MDLEKEHAFLVWIGDSSVVQFQQSKLGLFYFDTTDNDKAFLFHDAYKNNAYHISFIQIVTNNKTHLGPWELKGAEEAIRVSKLLLHPSQPTFEPIVTGNFICNVSITIANVNCANKVFSPFAQIADTVPITIPKSVLEEYQNGIL